MAETIPPDVMQFLGELAQYTGKLIEKYAQASEADDSEIGTLAFKYFTPLSVRVYTDDIELARFYEEGVDIWPKDE